MKKIPIYYYGNAVDLAWRIGSVLGTVLRFLLFTSSLIWFIREPNEVAAICMAIMGYFVYIKVKLWLKLLYLKVKIWVGMVFA